MTHDGRRDQKVKAVSPGGSRALVKRGRGTGRTPVDTWVSIDDCRLPTKHTLTKAERLAIARYLDLRWEGHTPVSQVRYEWTRWRKAHPAAAGDPAEEEAAIFDGEPEEEPEEEDGPEEEEEAEPEEEGEDVAGEPDAVAAAGMLMGWRPT